MKNQLNFENFLSSLQTASMTSWSYQSNNPCTVIVNDKIEGHSSTIPRECPTSVLHSSTETIASARDQQEISSSSSLGNNIGGKIIRVKRQAEEAHDDAEVVDVVFRGDGHENKSSSSYSHEKLGKARNREHQSSKRNFVNEQEEIEVIVEKRILLNISIAMDDGMGSRHLDVYHLQVAVPLPKQTRNAQNFFSYNVEDENLMEENLMPVHASPMTTIHDNQVDSDDSSAQSSSSSSATVENNIFDDFIESSTDEGLKERKKIFKLY